MHAAVLIVMKQVVARGAPQGGRAPTVFRFTVNDPRSREGRTGKRIRGQSVVDSSMAGLTSTACPSLARFHVAADASKD